MKAMETQHSHGDGYYPAHNQQPSEVKTETTEVKRDIPSAQIPVLPSDTLEMREGLEVEVHNRFSQHSKIQVVEPPAPSDKFKLVYFIFVLHGVGTLIPWNLILNAKDYFENYKLGRPYTSSPDAMWYSTNFFKFVYWSSQLPNVVFSWANIICPLGGSLKMRILATLTVEILVCAFTTVMVAVDTSNSPGLFFWLTILSVAVINTAGGLYQNSIYGIASKLDNYAAALVLGSNLSGVFVSLTSLVILATSPSKLKSALFYFGTTTVIMILCLVTYLQLPYFKFYQRRELKAKAEADQAETEVDTKSTRLSEFVEVFKHCWPQCLNVFAVFFVTLAIFPTVHANVRRRDPEFFIEDERYFVEVTCFLVFNLFAFFGNLIADWVQWPSEKHLWIPITLRLLFIPFFLLCNYHPYGFTRDESSVLFGDWVYLVGGMMMGLTNGYFSSLAMIYCPRTVETPEQASKAGMLGAAFLVLGVFVGVNFSNVMPYIVRDK